MELSEYNYQIIYRPGRDGKNVDALSRLPIDQEKQVNSMEKSSAKDEKENLQVDQLREPLFRDLINYITDRKLPKDDKTIKEIISLAEYFEVDDGILYHIWTPQEGRKKEEMRRQTALPMEWKYIALRECHDSNLTGGHLGFNKTYAKLRD